MSCRLCEMSTTARPLSARRLTRSSTCLVWATPSAAVGSSRMTRREFHCTAFATATDWRWPPESEATGWRIERIVVTASDFSVRSEEHTSELQSLRHLVCRLLLEKKKKKKKNKKTITYIIRGEKLNS